MRTRWPWSRLYLAFVAMALGAIFVVTAAPCLAATEAVAAPLHRSHQPKPCCETDPATSAPTCQMACRILPAGVDPPPRAPSGRAASHPPAQATEPAGLNLPPDDPPPR